MAKENISAFQCTNDTHCLASKGALWSAFVKYLNRRNMIYVHHANFPSNSANFIATTKTA